MTSAVGAGGDVLAAHLFSPTISWTGDSLYCALYFQKGKNSANSILQCVIHIVYYFG